MKIASYTRSLTTILSLSTMLTACGGGGGGSGAVPVTTLPEIMASDDTDMSTQSGLSNKETRKANATTAVNGANNSALTGTSGAQRSKRRSAAAQSELSDEAVTQAYSDLKDLFVDYSDDNIQKTSNQALVQALLLMGYTSDELTEIKGADGFTSWQDWCVRNSLMLQARATRAWDMYGEIDDNVSLKNATLKSVEINAVKQDSFLNFVVDDNGNITGLDFNIETASSSQRTMHFTKKDKGTFVYEGTLVTVVMDFEGRLDGGETWQHSFEIELLDEVTKDNFEDLKKRMIAKLYEDVEKGEFEDDSIVQALEEQIGNLKWDDVEKSFEVASGSNDHRDGNIYYVVTKNPVIITYNSYAQKGDLGLKYSDFGLYKGVETDKDTGESQLVANAVFAGGYEVAKIDKSKLSQDMTFSGKAVATALYQHDEGDDRTEYSKAFENGDATLKFEGATGKETLTTDFSADNWYTIVVTGNGGDNYDITFLNGDQIADDPELSADSGAVNYQGYRFNDDAEYSVNNFVGWADGGARYGSIDIGYYGENGTPSEATGYIGYGESIPDGNDGAESLHVTVGFGTVKQ